MRLYKLIQPERLKRRIAISNFGILPVPMWESCRQIARVAREGDIVYLKPKLLDIDGGLRSSQVLGDGRIFKATIGDDFGFMAPEAESTVNPEEVNADSELKTAFWYGEKPQIAEGIYQRLETERRWAIDLKGLYSEKRHRLGRRYAVGEQHMLEPNMGASLESGVIAIVTEGGVRVAGCQDGIYHARGSIVVSGKEINQHNGLHERFHFVGSSERI